MSNRYHLPVVVTTPDDVSREQVEAFVEAMLRNLEESEEVYRTFVEESSMEKEEARRLFHMLDRIDDPSLQAAEDVAEDLERND